MAETTAPSTDDSVDKVIQTDNREIKPPFGGVRSGLFEMAYEATRLVFDNNSEQEEYINSRANKAVEQAVKDGNLVPGQGYRFNLKNGANIIGQQFGKLISIAQDIRGNDRVIRRKMAYTQTVSMQDVEK